MEKIRSNKVMVLTFKKFSLLQFRILLVHYNPISYLLLEPYPGSLYELKKLI
jgi:hypothetical protein